MTSTKTAALDVMCRIFFLSWADIDLVFALATAPFFFSFSFLVQMRVGEFCDHHQKALNELAALLIYC